VDIATFIGILIAFGLVVASILIGGDATWFINYPSVMIVLGGTMGATLLAYPLADVMGVFRVVQNVFFPESAVGKGDDSDDGGVSPRRLGRRASFHFEAMIHRDRGPLSGQRASAGHRRNGVQCHRRGPDDRDPLRQERHKLGAEIFSTMGAFAPAIGMLGTIIGLVQMLMQMDDPSKIGPPMAVALLTTFYGTLLANLLFLPVSGKLKTRSRQEMLVKQMAMEGVIAIQSGDNHRIVEQKLKAFIAPKSRGEEFE
jgi:chemotaxis protein MotA